MKSAFLCAALLPSIATAGNFATCILERMPGVKAPQVSAAVVRACQAAHPDGLQGVAWGAGKGWFAKYQSPDECLSDKAKETALLIAVSHIRNACGVLYGKAPKPNRSDRPAVDWSQFELVEPAR